MVEPITYFTIFVGVGVAFVIGIAWFILLRPLLQKEDGGIQLLPVSLPRPVLFDEQFGDCEILGSRLLDGMSTYQVLLKKGNNTFFKSLNINDIVFLSNPLSESRLLSLKQHTDKMSERDILKSQLNSERQRRLKQDLDFDARFEEIGSFLQKFSKNNSVVTSEKGVEQK